MAPQHTTECREPSTGLDTSERTKIFPQSSFFKERRANALPTPAEIRAIAQKSGETCVIYRPPPVILPSLGLAVKYGTGIHVIEAQTQMMIREKLQGQVPVPEVFGWTEDDGQVFIYMALIEGETLEERWGCMNEDERISVCKELRHMAEAWRGLKQGVGEHYIGSLGQQPIHDIFIKRVGPYQGLDAVQQFHDTCRIDIKVDVPITFTHDDLVPPNIMLSSGPNPKVTAVIDWAQSGWYPAYWEYCKARIVDLDPRRFSKALMEEWHTKYLPMILDPVDEETFYYPMDYYVLSWGI